MNYYKTSLLLISMLFFLNLNAQVNVGSPGIDSLEKLLVKQKGDTNKINMLIELTNRLNQQSDFKNALQHAHEALSLSKKIKSKKAEGEAYVSIAGIYQRLNDSAKEIRNNVRLPGKFKEIKNRPEVPPFAEFMDTGTGAQKNYSEALKNLDASLKIREQIGDKKGMAQTYNSIGEIYSRQGKYNEALDKHAAALKLFEQSGVPGRPPRPDWYKSVAGTHILQGDRLFEKGDRSKATNQYSEALKNTVLALEGWEDAGEKDAVAQSYLSLGKLNIKLDKFPEAKQYLQKSVQVATELNDKNSLSVAYSNLSFLDDKQGNYKGAYEYYKLYVLYRDSLDKLENSKKSLQTQMKHDYEIKEANAKATQAKKDAEKKRAANMQYLIIVSLAIIILAVSVIVLIQHRNNKQKQKANFLLKQQKEKLQTTLSDLQSTQAQLIQSEKMASLGELTAGIAHEIQNPLNFVNNFSEINKELLVEMKGEITKGNLDEIKIIADDVIGNEEKINHHGKRADSIVKAMLQHSRSSTGQKEPTDINALTDEYLRLSYHGLRAKNKTFNATIPIAIETDFDESIGKINLIPQDIGRVLLNLFNNAFYAVQDAALAAYAHAGTALPPTLPGYLPKVTVTTRPIKVQQNDIGPGVLISVKDNGKGISPKIFEKIFQPFFTTKPAGEGTGLGLSLSYDIIKAHGGQIKVETQESAGSEFIIQLPVN